MMKIATIELTVPQRRLMEIFAETEVHGEYGDSRARVLLTYLRERLKEAKIPSPMLDALLDGTLPPLDFSRFFDMVMREVYSCSPGEGAGMSPFELSPGEYRDALLNCFPKIIHDLFPEPVATIDPAWNLLVTWTMWYGDKIRDELLNVTDDELISLLGLIYEYLWACTENHPAYHRYFLSHWTRYLLTREWPDKEEELRELWEKEKTLRVSFQNVNAHLVAENTELRNSDKERFITVMDAARAVLRVVYGQDNVDAEADALKKRIVRNNPQLTAAFPGQQGRIFFPVETLIPLFQADRKIGLTEGQIADSIRAKGLPEDKLPQKTRT